jgi:hypothetical protein
LDIASFLEILANASLYAYILVFVIGLGWIVIGMILGGLHGMIDFASDVADADGDSGHGVGLSPFSPLMIAVFGTLFGLTGMGLTIYTSLNSLVVLLLTTGIAAVFDFGFYKFLFTYFVEAQASSLPSPDDAVGSAATVATRIDPGRTGTINFQAAGRLQVAGARHGGESPIEAGQVVRIVSMRGGVAQVKKEE